ncbi:MAG TPA: DNA polymerase III subunit delta [Solirubrobacteraceae bacterium]|nr:DNA polymerase III subunit delta [Solirubrobacteraceae bacterium]
MAELKPVYLIHGDDHGAISERRARLRALGEGDGGAGNVEMLDGDAASPAGVALALAAMTFALGRRVIIVDGIERWKQADVERDLLAVLADMPPDTTLALFAREEGRAKAPAALHKAVKAAGGQLVSETKIKPWELPGWAREQAARKGLLLDAAAAKALVAQVGERQQRLLRELEKLALEVETPSGETRITVDDIDQRAAHSAEWRAFSLADALVGADTREATLSYLRLREQGERLSGLTYLMAQRLRDALGIATRLQAGDSVADVKRSLRMPPRAAERMVADVARSDPARLREALGTLADLELDTRGGAVVGKKGLAALEEDTLALRAVQAITQ